MLWKALCSYSFIFYNWFILIKVKEDEKPVPEALGMRQESTLDEMPVHQSPGLHKHIPSPRGSLL